MRALRSVGLGDGRKRSPELEAPVNRGDQKQALEQSHLLGYCALHNHSFHLFLQS